MSNADTPRFSQPDLPPFFELVALESVDSTSNEAARRADLGAGEGLLIWAREQTKGRGRQGRQWESPIGNLYCSMLLKPNVEPATAAELGFVVGVAVRECVQDLVPVAKKARCKWPNDVLLDGAKIAGVLLEATAREDAIRIIAGIGINLVSHPDNTSYPATDLQSETTRPADPARVLEQLAVAFLRWRDVWLTQGFAALRPAWLDHAAGLGETIRVRLPNREFSGEFLSLDERGALQLREAGGEIQTISAGDVFLAGVGR